MLEYGSSLIKIGSNYSARCQQSRGTCISRIREAELWNHGAHQRSRSNLLFRPPPLPPPTTFKGPSCGSAVHLQERGLLTFSVQHEIPATFPAYPGDQNRRQLIVLAGCAPSTPAISTTHAVAGRADASFALAAATCSTDCVARGSRGSA
jgi:hypothetical protein